MERVSLLRRPREVKAARISELERLYRQYTVVGIVDLTRTSSDLLHSLRARLRGVAVLKSVKKSLAIKAAQAAGRGYIAEELSRMGHPLLLIFTNMSPFTLKLELDRSRLLTPPKPGERADIDVIIPPMNTGLQPGPILSEFGKMKIPTRIDGGTIWIARETVVAKAGEVIQPTLASLLAKLEIGAVYRSINLIMAFDGDIKIPSKLLHIDVEGSKKSLADAYSLALTLAIRVCYVVSETAAAIIREAYLGALALSTQTGYVTRENIGQVLAQAFRQASLIKSVVDSRAS
ncbi:MAG: 50S ribosomal protein L10 [Candidatus Caldarchaeales archaeon]|jgi:large subunit ribosomal protein L10|nr:50S ribosomal protein L10 [Candidatus Caldarchaeales archaeon]MDT7915341.1 50S ribosomal protein L10 [Candidatus Caldarchaeales archaeon]